MTILEEMTRVAESAESGTPVVHDGSGVRRWHAAVRELVEAAQDAAVVVGDGASPVTHENLRKALVPFRRAADPPATGGETR